MTKGPNFFLIGAPKCGTTSMAGMLSCSEGVFVPSVKEPHFFGSDLPKPHGDYFRDPEAYFSLYEDSGGSVIRADCSVWYYRSATAANEIKEYSPDAKVVLMVRDPVTMLQSLYYHKLYSGDEQNKDIGDAILHRPQPAPSLKWTRWGLEYLEAPKWQSWIPAWNDSFGSNFKIIVFEQFVNDPWSSYKEVCEFLGVKPNDEAMQYAHENLSRKNRSLFFQRVLNLLPLKFKKIISRSVGRNGKRKISSWINKTFKSTKARELSETEKRKIAELFKEDRSYLEKEFSLDLRDLWY